jgi:hypothetical protein
MYADHAANDAQPRDRDVDRAVARLFAERAKQEAVRLNRQGHFTEAAEVLDGVRRRVAAYAGSDPVLLQLGDELAVEAPAYAAPMAELARKQRYFASSNIARMRTPDGRSQKA